MYHLAANCHCLCLRKSPSCRLLYLFCIYWPSGKLLQADFRHRYWLFPRYNCQLCLFSIYRQQLRILCSLHKPQYKALNKPLRGHSGLQGCFPYNFWLPSKLCRWWLRNQVGRGYHLQVRRLRVLLQIHRRSDLRRVSCVQLDLWGVGRGYRVFSTFWDCSQEGRYRQWWCTYQYRQLRLRKGWPCLCRLEWWCGRIWPMDCLL